MFLPSCLTLFNSGRNLDLTISFSINRIETCIQIKVIAVIRKSSIKQLVYTPVKSFIIPKQIGKIKPPRPPIIPTIPPGVPLDIKLKSTINKISRHLTIKTYIDLVCSGSLKITNQEIKEYYNKNKEQFLRHRLAARINHFIVSDKKEATKIKSILAKHKHGTKRDELFINHRVFSDIVIKGTLNEALDKLIFTKRKKKKLVGPLGLKNKFHLVEILETFPKGSPLGVDLVYDEIYQRLLNKKLASKKEEVLDSLRNEAEIAVNNKTIK